MEGVRLKGLAPVLLGRPVEHPRPVDIDGDRGDDDEESPGVGVDRDNVDEDADDGLVDDPGAGDEK
jgi:hypothetical protein